MMKRMLALLLGALLLCVVPAAFAEALDDFDDPFGDIFADDGYSGEWMALGDLNMEMCLPEGWTADAAQPDEAFRAHREDGAATLIVRVAGEEVEDLIDWATEYLDEFEWAEAGFNEVALRVDGARTQMWLLGDGDRVIEFDFTGEDELIFPMVGTVYEIWGGDDFDWSGDDPFAAFGDAVG